MKTEQIPDHKIATVLGILADHPADRNTKVGDALWQASKYVRRLESENAALREDKARLDWVESNGKVHWAAGRSGTSIRSYLIKDHLNLGARAAIDAAKGRWGMSDTPNSDMYTNVPKAVVAELERELAAVTAERDALTAVIDRIDDALADIGDIAHGDLGLMVSQARTLCRLDLTEGPAKPDLSNPRTVFGPNCASAHLQPKRWVKEPIGPEVHESAKRYPKGHPFHGTGRVTAGGRKKP